MALSLMHMLCSLYQPSSTNSVTMELSMQGNLIDIVSDILVNCQMAEDLASELGNLDHCYCGEEDKRQKRSVVNRSMVLCQGQKACRKRGTQFHANCINESELGHDQIWICATCETDPVKILSKLMVFYRQFQSNYCDFSLAQGLVKDVLHFFKTYGKARLSYKDQGCSGESESEEDFDEFSGGGA